MGLTEEGGAKRAPGAAVQEGDKSHLPAPQLWGKHLKGGGRIAGEGQERQSWQSCA